jgi:hypothetical protein
MATAGALLTGLAFIATFFTAGPAPAQDERTLVLHVDNYARFPSNELTRAEREAARVYEAAGVRVVWVHGNEEADTRDAGGKHLRVLLLGTRMTSHKAGVDSIGSDALGSAARETGRAWIFTQRVIEMSLSNLRDPDVVLGRVMAHEIGHLLLHEHSHSPRGIMRAHLNFRKRNLEIFTTPEAAEILIALNR